MKIATDIVQSKRLAKVLPIESADMVYQSVDDDESFDGTWELLPASHPLNIGYKDDVPCWSLSALLDILAEQDFIVKSVVYSNEYQYNIDIPSRHCKIWFSSLLDAAFEMICWLKENNKL